MVSRYQQVTVCGSRIGREVAEMTVQGEDRSDEDLILTIAALPLKTIVLIGMDEPS